MQGTSYAGSYIVAECPLTAAQQLDLRNGYRLLPYAVTESLENTRRKLSVALWLLRQKPVRIALFGDAYCRSVYEMFTARHKKLPLTRRKSFGVALRDLDVKPANLFGGPRFELLRRKVRRARRLGYTFRRFDPQERLNEIVRVNGSTAIRQRRAIQPRYLDPVQVASYCAAPGAWYGVFDADQVLRGYCHTPMIGDCGLFSRILGDAESLNDGIMYLLVFETLGEMHKLLSQTGHPRWAMYDMFLGGSQGLRDFKHRCGFDPYRVTWHWHRDRSG